MEGKKKYMYRKDSARMVPGPLQTQYIDRYFHKIVKWERHLKQRRK